MPVTRKIFLDRSDRLQRMPVPPDDLQRIAVRLAKRGVSTIDLSRLSRIPHDASEEGSSSTDGAPHRPANDEELQQLNDAIVCWYDHRFGVKLDPLHEVAVLPNTVLAMHFLALAFVDPGEMVLLPDPGAAFLRGAVALCGGATMPYHLLERNDYLPSFSGLEAGLVGRTRMIVLGYPHNPTSAAADLATMTQTVKFARKHNILAVLDAAFTFATSGAFRPRSLLEAVGAKGVAVEIAALGPNFGCAEFPISAVCGNRDAVSAVSFLISASQLRPSSATVARAISLLQNAEKHLARRDEFQSKSRRLIAETTAALGWNPRSSPTAPFIWLTVPSAVGTRAFCRRLLRRTGVLIAPGTDFGELGEGYARLALPNDAQTLQTVVERLTKHAKLTQRRLPRPRTMTGKQRSRGASSGD